MTRQPSIRVVLPDTGPLISLALGESLDLLLAVASDVRLVLTDVVEFEATHRADDLPDAQAIRAFLRSHADRIEVMPTTIGSIALADLKRKAEAGLPAALPKDLGELSITNFVMSLRTSNPGDPMLVIIEDDWFAENAYAVPGNIHLLSTSAWLDGLEALGRIPSASDVRSRIQSRRPNFRADFFVDLQAEKIVGGTEWPSSFKG
jgi:hypothetical protein